MRRLALLALLLTTPAHADEEITFAAVGDVMLGSAFPDEKGLPPDDGAGLLAEVTPLLAAADITFGNLEGPLADAGETKKCGPPPKKKATKKCWVFRVPTRYGKYLKDAGFKVMSLANNHALDFGPEGRASSRQVLDALGIAHSGEPGDIAHLTVKGKKVEVIAFATYDHSYNLNKLDEAYALVEERAKQADLVIVSFHGGAEGADRLHVPDAAEMFYNENRGDLRVFARAMIDAGAALVVGHGPHVVRGMEVYKGHLIAYSLGNFATYGGINVNGVPGISLILEVHLGAAGRFLGGKVHPVRQSHPGGPHLDHEGAVIKQIQQLSREDFGAAAVSLADDGTLAPPP